MDFRKGGTVVNRFARWIVKHRVAVVIICLLMLIPSVLGMNATKVKYDLLYYLPEDLDTVKGQNILMEEFGKGAFSMLVIQNMPEKDVAELKTKLEQVDHDSFRDSAGRIPEHLREGRRAADGGVLR